MKLMAWRLLFRFVILAHVLFAAPPAAFAQIKIEQLVLDAGRARIKSAIKGDDTIDYRFSGNASAELKCSSETPPSLGLPPLDKTCEVRVVRRADAVELWILKPGTAQ